MHAQQSSNATPPRSIRRAAERQAFKLARKQSRLDAQAKLAVPPPGPETLEEDLASSELPSCASPSLEPNPVSEAQFAANRANAQLSSGPTSIEGKAVSSRNHTSHGLTSEPSNGLKVLPGEDQSAYDASLAAFETEWKPSTATERDLVKRLATHSWLRDRAIRLQDRIVAQSAEQLDGQDRKLFELFGRYYTTHARSFSKAFSEIMRLRNFQSRQEKDQAILERRALEIQIRFDSQKRAAEAHAAKMETLRLKQEAIKLRNLHTPLPKPEAQSAPHFTEKALSQSA